MLTSWRRTVTSLIIAGAHLDLNQGSVEYTRYFGLAHRMAWVTGGVPVAGLSGSVSGTRIQGSVIGTGDSSYQFGILLKGGPALTPAEFEEFKPTTVLGCSFNVTAPTGLYRPNRILNLGSDRWAFGPEIAVSQPFGSEQQWQLDIYGNCDFYTDNTAFHGRQILRQNPLPGLEGHISYTLTERLWVSLDTRYSARGSTLVDGVDQSDSQQNFTLGDELNVELNKQNSLLFEWAKVLAHRNGPSSSGFALKYAYTWGKGFRLPGHRPEEQQ